MATRQAGRPGPEPGRRRAPGHAWCINYDTLVACRAAPNVAQGWCEGTARPAQVAFRLKSAARYPVLTAMEDLPLPQEQHNQALLRDVYQAARDYLVVESDEWSRFNAMLVAHVVLIIVAVSVMYGGACTYAPAVGPLVLLLGGLAVCFAWWAKIERGFRSQDRYVGFIKNLEAELPEKLRFLTDGANVRMIFPSTPTTRNAMRLVIGVFALLYLVALSHLVLPCLRV